MDINKIFTEYRRRIKTERMLKSLVWGTLVGFSISAVFALLYWMLAFGTFWLGTVIGLTAGAASVILLYTFRYTADEKTVAKK